MCGRFSFASSSKKITAALGKDIQIMGELQVSYNIAPTQSSYVVTNEQPNLLQSFQWGLIPYWAKNGKNAAKLINARMEEIENKVSFKTPIRERRCLILVDSFYEWKKLGKQKNAYRILMKNEKLMVMAGIWDIWNNNGRLVKTFSIITTSPNREMAKVHTRMPLILNDSEIQRQWLAQATLSDTLSLLKTPADDILNIYRISNKVNTVKNNSPDLHQQIPEALTLFD